MKQWIKLYIEILDDPKMGRMPDWLFRRAIELFLLAGRNGNDGVLPPVEDMAWILRLDETKLREALHCLEEVGVVHEAEPDVWVVTHFAERQDADSPAERVANHRKNVTKRYRNVTQPVTKRYGEEDKEEEKDKDKEAEVEEESRTQNLRAPDSATAATATAIAATATASNPHDAGQIFREYESNFGVLTPLIADRLGELIDHYPRDWIQAAFREALAHEARNIKYVEAILRRWKRDGFQSGHKKTGEKKAETPTEEQIERMIADLEAS